MIWNQTDVSLFANQSGNGKYNPISVSFNMIPKIFLCVRSCWKNNSDQTYNCPRDWHLSAVMCAQLRTPPETHRTTTQLSYTGGPSFGPQYVERHKPTYPDVKNYSNHTPERLALFGLIVGTSEISRAIPTRSY